ncbi:MAG: hypothetical protein JSU92_05345 [Deltaproteobacteria bacterium]|nr:MAG: hypothetical protein JSU92_05345 [Deltaproteobacteria bacterium]
MATPEEDLKRLRIIMSHWLKHNREHIEEDRKWLAKVEEAGLEEVAENLRKVIQLSEEISRYIKAAMEKLGGPAENGYKPDHI